MSEVGSGEAPGLLLAWPRLTEPERRSRVVGYLAHAPAVLPGWLGDGDWVWPRALADQVRAHGGGAPAQLLDHIASRAYVVPDTVPAQWIAAAVRELQTGRPGETEVGHPEADLNGVRLYTVVDRGAEPGSLPMLLRVADGGSRRAYFGPYGWQRLTGGDWPAQVRGDGDLVELAPRQAAEIADRRVAAQFEQFLARDRETAATDGASDPAGAAVVRFARTYDGEGPDHRAWFSPGRVRIRELARRQRLAAYLSGGELAVRVTSHMTDPLDPAGSTVVPLNLRTDGTWVWQEALAYYVLAIGVAPELELLCHIEERGYKLGEPVSDEVVRLAARTVRSRPPKRPIRQEYEYLVQSPPHGCATELGVDSDEPVLMRRPLGGGWTADGAAEVFTGELRWRRVTSGMDLDGVGTAISNVQAIQMVDRRWADQVADGRCWSFRPWNL